MPVSRFHEVAAGPRRTPSCIGTSAGQRHLNRLQSEPRAATVWPIGTEILFRGELVRLETADASRVKFGPEMVSVENPAADLRPVVEHHLRKLACRELPPRVTEFATRHRLPVRRITVRNQRSRWGSCSRHGTISLNWRLIQAPDFVAITSFSMNWPICANSTTRTNSGAKWSGCVRIISPRKNG